MSTAGQQLTAMLEQARSLDEARAFLDALPDALRPKAVRCLDRGAQQTLWRLAEGFLPLSLADLVPADHPPLTPVRHFGRNSLLAFTHFEKRFYRFSGDAARLGGANFQTISPITGPGYYVAREDAGRGEVLVDYTLLPDAHPPGWPDVVPNERGISRFIYGHMVDTLRRVSEHVTIGRAARRGKAMSAWFVLCREASP